MVVFKLRLNVLPAASDLLFRWGAIIAPFLFIRINVYDRVESRITAAGVWEERRDRGMGGRVRSGDVRLYVGLYVWLDIWLGVWLEVFLLGHGLHRRGGTKTVGDFSLHQAPLAVLSCVRVEYRPVEGVRRLFTLSSRQLGGELAMRPLYWSAWPQAGYRIICRGAGKLLTGFDQAMENMTSGYSMDRRWCIVDWSARVQCTGSDWT